MDTTRPPPAGPHRLFFALWPGAELRGRIAATAAQVDAQYAPGGRPLDPGRYHITLQFLGEFSPLPAERVESACEAADRVAFEPFDLVLDRVGGFAGSRVWWLGCGEMPRALQALHDALGLELAGRGIAVKAHPRFTPHLTIRRGVRHQMQARPITPLAWQVRGFALVDSDPRLGYVLRARWGLPDADA